MTETSTSSSSGSSSSVPTVVNTPQSDFSLLLAKTLGAMGQYTLGLAMSQFAKGIGVTDDVINQFARIASAGEGLANTIIGQYNNTFKPEMDAYVRKAQSYNSVGRQQYEMGKAGATAGIANQAALHGAEQDLQRFGINPDSGRYQELILAHRLADGAARAGAENQARDRTEQTGIGMMQNVAQMGLNLPGMANNAQQTAGAMATGAQNASLGQQNTLAQAGNTAMGNAMRPLMPAMGQNSQSQQRGQSQSNKPQQEQEPKGQGSGIPQGAGQARPGSYGGGTQTQGTGSYGIPQGGSPGSSYNDPDLWYNGGTPALYDANAWDFLGDQGANPDGMGDQAYDAGSQYDSGQPFDESGAPADYGQDNSYSDFGQSYDTPDPSMGADMSSYQDTSYDPTSYDSGSSEGFAQGGRVPQRGVLPTTGGQVPQGASPSQGRQTDDIPARLNAGEFVVPRDVVAHQGTKFFNDLIAKSRRLRTGMSGPPAKPKMKPALRMNPSFVSQGM